MTPTEKLKEFKKKFLDLTSSAANAGLPLQNIILELETEKFRLQAINLQRMAEHDALELAKAIVPAGVMPGMTGFDGKRNGRSN